MTILVPLLNKNYRLLHHKKTQMNSNAEIMTGVFSEVTSMGFDPKSQNIQCTFQFSTVLQTESSFLVSFSGLNMHILADSGFEAGMWNFFFRE